MAKTKAKAKRVRTIFSVDGSVQGFIEEPNLGLHFFWSRLGLVSLFTPFLCIHILTRRVPGKDGKPRWDVGLRCDGVFVDPMKVTGLRFMRFSLGPLISLSWISEKPEYFSEYLIDLIKKTNLQDSSSKDLSPPDLANQHACQQKSSGK